MLVPQALLAALCLALGLLPGAVLRALEPCAGVAARIAAGVRHRRGARWGWRRPSGRSITWCPRCSASRCSAPSLPRACSRRAGLGDSPRADVGLRR